MILTYSAEWWRWVVCGVFAGPSEYRGQSRSARKRMARGFWFWNRLRGTLVDHLNRELIPVPAKSKSSFQIHSVARLVGSLFLAETLSPGFITRSLCLSVRIRHGQVCRWSSGHFLWRVSCVYLVHVSPLTYPALMPAMDKS